MLISLLHVSVSVLIKYCASDHAVVRLADIAAGRRNTLGRYLVLLFAVISGNALADPYQCGKADVVTISSAALANGDYLSCTARSRIDLGPNLTVSPGAELDARAPEIRFLPDVDIADGAGFSAGPGACGVPVTFEAGKIPTQEIHVDVNGVNSNACGAIGSPCASIEFAATLAQPGTAIIVHAGIYTGDQNISSLSGTPEQPIWIGGAAGETTPILEGGTVGLFLSQVRYLIVHDLVFRNSAINGINADDGGSFADADATRYLVFRNLSMLAIGTTGNQDCLKISGVDDFWIYDSTFQSCGAAEAIDGVGCHNGVVSGNRFFNLQNSSSAVQFKGGSEDVEIRANLFESAGSRAINLGGATGLGFFRPPVSEVLPNAEARNIRAVANVIRGSQSAMAFEGCVDCLAANNTIDTPEHWVMRILQSTTTSGAVEFLPVSNGRFINNIVYFDDQVSSAVNIGQNTAADTFVFQSNLWYRYDMPTQSAPPGGLPVAESNAFIGVDPDFANPGLGDFHIDNTSPAYRSGAILSEISADFDGFCYPSPPSRGAFEFE